MATIKKFNKIKQKTINLYKAYQEIDDADGDWTWLYDAWLNREEELKQMYIELHISTFGFRPLSYGLSSQTLTNNILEGNADVE